MTVVLILHVRPNLKLQNSMLGNMVAATICPETASSCGYFSTTDRKNLVKDLLTKIFNNINEYTTSMAPGFTR